MAPVVFSRVSSDGLPAVAAERSRRRCLRQSMLPNAGASTRTREEALRVEVPNQDDGFVRSLR